MSFNRERKLGIRDAFVFLSVFDFRGRLAEERRGHQVVSPGLRRPSRRALLKTAHAAETPAAHDGLPEPPVRAGRTFACSIRVLDRNELEGLMQLCDAVVSLHRAEGHGPGAAGSDALGKPVLATGYSANEDFMNVENSLPVRLPAGGDRPRPRSVHRRGWVWAEPDTEHATELMRLIVQDRDLGRRLGAQAQQDVLRALNARQVGELRTWLEDLLERPLASETHAAGARYS